MNRKIVAIIFVSILLLACSVTALPVKRLDQSGGFSLDKLFIQETSTNVYILSNEKKECIIIDPAVRTKEIVHTLKINNYSPKAILLTHNHFDHTTGVIKLSDILKIPVVTNRLQVQMGKTMLGKPLTGSNLIYASNGQLIQFANIDIRILFTPGHSPGSMCFYHEASDFLFSGDTLFRESIGRTDFPGSEREKIVPSISSLLSSVKPETKIYPGHGEQTTKKHEQLYNPFLNN